MPDNSDVMSSASYSASALYDELGNLDSISQVDNSYHQSQGDSGAGVDLSSVTVEMKKRDKKIEELEAARAKLK